MEIPEEKRNKVEELARSLSGKGAALLPIIHLLKEDSGHIPDRLIPYLCGLLSLPPAMVEGVISFYSMFRRGKVGNYVICLCRNLSCSLLGREEILRSLEEALGVEVGETTSDGLFTLCEVECLGSCGTAPVMMINEDYYESLTPERAVEIVSAIREREKGGGQGG